MLIKIPFYTNIILLTLWHWKGNICNGFATTGRIPCDPDHVLDSLNLITKRNYNGKLAMVVETPYTLLDVKKQAKHIQEHGSRRGTASYSPSETAFQHFLKGVETIVHE